LFSGAIKKDHIKPKEGELVCVHSSSGEALGIGLFSSRGSIAVKMLSSTDEPVDLGFWRKRFTQACARRKKLGLFANPQTDAFRLLNAEGDSVPGLIVDVYGGTAVVQIQNAALEPFLEDISQALKDSEDLKLSAGYFKSYEQGSSESRYLWGSSDSSEVRENGYFFHVDWEKGQKTGFFLDQRENRQLLSKFCSGAKVLNAFCYTGGFSVYAFGGGAREVVSLDSSKPALQILDTNIRRNFPQARHEIISEDYFKFMQNFPNDFDVIVLDPPAFAKDRRAVKSGIKGYRSINEAAFRALPKGGILFTFSCSQLVGREEFSAIVADAAGVAGRTSRILHQLCQAPCHPVQLAHPEGAYLKGLALSVD